jgi:hypothetical protein
MKRVLLYAVMNFKRTTFQLSYRTLSMAQKPNHLNTVPVGNGVQDQNSEHSLKHEVLECNIFVNFCIRFAK